MSASTCSPPHRPASATSSGPSYRAPQLGDELAWIAVFGNGLTVLAGEHARPEPTHLPAGVVHVVLAGDDVTGAGEQAGERVAVARKPTVPDVQRAGGVRGDELDHHPLAVSEIGPGVVVDAAGDDVVQHLVEPRVVEPEVHEARSGDLDLGDVRQIGRVQMIGQLGRELAGVATGRLRGGERHVRRPVAVLGDPGAFEHDLAGRLDPERRQRGAHRGGEVVPDHPLIVTFAPVLTALTTGQTLGVDRLGDPDAPPTLLLHGLSGSRLAYRAVVGHLDGDVWNVDLRGHGESSRAPLESYDAASYAADIAALIDSEIGRPALVVGHSLGGVVAAELARSRPDLVAAVFLEDPPLYEGDAERRSNSPAAKFFPELIAAVRELQGRNAPVEDYLPLAMEPTAEEASRPLRVTASVGSHHDGGGRHGNRVERLRSGRDGSAAR